VAGKDDGLITAVTAAEDFIVFGTNKGNIYSMLPDAPKSLWEFEAAGGLVGQIVRDSNSLFFAGEDFNVYRVDVPDIYSKEFIWKTLVPGMIQKPPRVTEKMVYQSSFGKNMTLSGIDRDSGRIIWEVPGGVELLAESRGKAYVITENGTLVVMHNASAKQVYSVNFAKVSRQACNTLDSKIYIGDKTGMVVCLEPLN
jgi:outer membrane protein assembly factor BamB